jgi:hypothetical protein
MPRWRKDENVFGKMLSIWILGEVVAEIRYNGNVCMAIYGVSVSNTSFYSVQRLSQLTQ